MKTIDDPVFGKLYFNEYYWEQHIQFTYEGKTYEIPVIIYGEDNEIFQDYHYASFTWLQKNLPQALSESISALEKHVIDDTDKHSFDLTMLVIPYSFNNEISCVGLLFDSLADEEHGFAVKYVNGRIHSIGEQGIVL